VSQGAHCNVAEYISVKISAFAAASCVYSSSASSPARYWACVGVSEPAVSLAPRAYCMLPQKAVHLPRFMMLPRGQEVQLLERSPSHSPQL